MADKKFLIALVVIFILLLVLVYVLFIEPSIQGYVIKKQIEAQKIVVNAIIQQANQQGAVQLTNGEQTIVLALVPNAQQQNNQKIE